jgi:lysophospholipase L1-like esterase
MKTILFQGDSITDCGRSRDAALVNTQAPAALGLGYPYLASCRLALDHPGEYRFVNRGISGNRIVDLYARIKIDFINLRPDYMSILIGINDVWHEVNNKNGVATPKFERIYRMLLDEIYEELPDLKILLFTPYVLKGSATVDPENPAKWEYFRDGCAEKAEAVMRIAKDYPVGLSVTQPLFDAAEATVAPDQLLRDGVHPSTAGHEILAREFTKWFESVNK